MERQKTVGECLKAIGSVDFSGCETLSEEFARIKKAYFAAILIHHPDKGGDAAAFREVNTAWEILRQMKDSGTIDSFASSSNLEKVAAEKFAGEWDNFPMPSWEYYEAAEEEAVPTYCVEPAKTGRGKCFATGISKKCTEDHIAAGEIRWGASVHFT